MSYGQTLKYIRTRKGLTQKQVASDIVTDSFIAKFEKGDSNISFELLLQILDCMCVDLEEFIALDKTTRLENSLSITECIDVLESIIDSNNKTKALSLKKQLENNPNPLCKTIENIIEYVFLVEDKYLELVKKDIIEWDYVGHAELTIFNIAQKILDISFTLSIYPRILRMHNEFTSTRFLKDRNNLYTTIIKKLINSQEEVYIRNIIEEYLYEFNIKNNNKELLSQLNYCLSNSEKETVNSILKFNLFEKHTTYSLEIAR